MRSLYPSAPVTAAPSRPDLPFDALSAFAMLTLALAVVMEVPPPLITLPQPTNVELWRQSWARICQDLIDTVDGDQFLNALRISFNLNGAKDVSSLFKSLNDKSVFYGSNAFANLKQLIRVLLLLNRDKAFKLIEEVKRAFQVHISLEEVSAEQPVIHKYSTIVVVRDVTRHRPLARAL